jgi:hypothetical protein
MTISQQGGTVAFAAITDPVRCTASDPPFGLDERKRIAAIQIVLLADDCPFPEIA